MSEPLLLLLAWTFQSTHTNGYRFQRNGLKQALLACFCQHSYFHPRGLHLTKAFPWWLNENATKGNLLTVDIQHVSLATTLYWARAKQSRFLRSTASSFRRGEATVLRGKWMNEGFMEMRKCNGSLFSIPVAGTVTVCVFYHRHERRTMSLSAINNMVSFKADYPSVRVKGNKRWGDNCQS